MSYQKSVERTVAVLVTIIMTFVVMMIAVFALSVPASTEEAETFCGYEQHKHNKDCYTKELACGLEETEGHKHTDECYEEQVIGYERGELICGQEETPDQAAVPGHTHADECYEEQVIGHERGELICGQEESDDHTHTDACYEQIPVTEEVLVCEQEEMPDQEAIPGHVHTDECYEQIPVTEEVLVCGQDESEPHKHTKACYTKVLTCDLEEHKHTEECYSDLNADVESADMWEATLPQTLSGVWADDLVAVAESQLGYVESSRNFHPGETRRFGYSRYGAWYGNAYGDWCAMFVSFCLYYADIPSDAMMRDANCPNWVANLKAEKMFRSAHGKHAYVPVKGDIIFFDWESDGVVDHVGIVVEVKDDCVKTIEGNSGDMVQYCLYDVDSDCITGYGKLPVNPEDPIVKAAKQARAEEAARAAEATRAAEAARMAEATKPAETTRAAEATKAAEEDRPEPKKDASFGKGDSKPKVTLAELNEEFFGVTAGESDKVARAVKDGEGSATFIPAKRSSLPGDQRPLYDKADAPFMSEEYEAEPFDAMERYVNWEPPVMTAEEESAASLQDEAQRLSAGEIWMSMVRGPIISASAD